MRAWLTPQQIADLRLPGLPTSKRGVLDLAEREGWAARADMTRPAKRRGGGVEFSMQVLPAEARAAATAHVIGRVAVPAEVEAEAAAAPGADRLSVPASEGRDARLAILAVAAKFRDHEGLGQDAADRLFCIRYSLGTVAVDDWILQSIPVLKVRTLQRWRAAAARGDFARIAVDHGARRRGKGMLDRDDVNLFIFGRMVSQDALSSRHIRDLVAIEFPALKDIAERTVRLAMAKLREDKKVEFAALTNPDAFRSKYRVAGSNSHQVARLNELWMIDASPADVMTTDGRQAVYVCIDIYSRRLQIYVTQTPRAEAVCLLMRRAILPWGTPERVKTDNGSDFKATRTKRLMASLGIEVETSTAFSPWEKGHIERAIKSVQHDLMAMLPGYIGHNVADRKRIEERRAFAARIGKAGEETDDVFCIDLTAAELQSYCDRWAEERYATKPHAGLNGVTPRQAAAGYVGAIRTVDLHALDVLLAPIADGDGTRIVGKQGVRIKGRHYLSQTVLPSTRVFVRMDPADMGRAWLFDESGEEYLGEAVCPELAGIDPAEFVAATRRMHAKILKDGMVGVRAEMKRLSHRDVADMLLRQEAIDDGVLVEFPRPTVAHETPHLRAAAAVERTEAAPVASLPVAAEEAPEGVTLLHPRETPRLRYRRARALEARIAAGEAIPTADALWLGAYRTDTEYLAMAEMDEDFGEAALR